MIRPAPLHMHKSRRQAILENVLLPWESPLWSGVFAWLLYSLLSLSKIPFGAQSTNPYYNYLADAFLHGQFHLRLPPPALIDLVNFGEKLYLYWPPFPAILMMPFVAVFGVDFSDVLFTIFVAGLNVSIFAAILIQVNHRSLIQLSKLRRAWLVIFFALGTVHLTTALYGRVWLTGQIVGFFVVSLAYLSVLKFEGKRAFFFFGFFMACAALTRNHLLFTGIWPAYYLWTKLPQKKLRQIVSAFFWTLLPLGAAFAALLSYNWLRFGGLFDVGLSYHMMSDVFKEDYLKYGVFHLHYFPINFYYHFIFYPYPLRFESQLGGSLFLLSPLFFGIFSTIWKEWRNPSVIALLLSILVTSIPIMLLMGTGGSLGNRYSLDFTVPLLVLTVYGIKNWPVRRIGLLVLISIIHYVAAVFIFAYKIVG